MIARHPKERGANDRTHSRAGERRRRSGAARALSQHHLHARRSATRATSSRSSRAASSRSRPGPFVTPNYSFALRAPRDEWETFWQQVAAARLQRHLRAVQARQAAHRGRPASVHGEPALLQGRAGAAAQGGREQRAAAQPAEPARAGFEPIVGPLSQSRAARPPAPALHRGGRPGHSAALPAHRRLRRPAVPRPAQRRRASPRTTASSCSTCRGTANRRRRTASRTRNTAHLARLRPDDPGGRRRARARQAGGDGLLDRRPHRALSRAPARRALPRHHRARIRRPRRALLRRDWLHRPDVHGGEVSAGVVSGLVAPTAPDNHRWETLWHYLQSGPGVFKGDLYFYKVDGDIRDRIDQIDGRKANLYLLTGEYDYSCTTEGTLDIARRTGARGHHHEGPRPFPDERGPAEVHLRICCRCWRRSAARSSILAANSLHPPLDGPSPGEGDRSSRQGCSLRTTPGDRHVPRRSRPHAATRRRRDRPRWSSSPARLRYDALPEEARHYARRHLLDTVGVMIAGARGSDRDAGRDRHRGGAPGRQNPGAGPRSGAPTCSTPRSSAAPRRTASSSTTATATARRIAAASSCRRRSRSATTARRPAAR